MKTIATVALLTLIVASNVYGQKGKGKSAPKTTFVDRITKYMNITDPRPCGFYLVDWGTTPDDLMKEAQRIGLGKPSIDTNTDGSIDYSYNDPEKDLLYSFGFRAGRYVNFMVLSTYTETASAVERYERLAEILWLYWDGKKGDHSALTKCADTGKDVFFYISRDKGTVTVAVQSPAK